MLVDELYEEHGSDQVIDKLKADKTLDESVRKVALQLANTRLWEYARGLLFESVHVLILPDRDIDEYRVALEKVERAKELAPDNPITQASLGLAQYRIGRDFPFNVIAGTPARNTVNNIKIRGSISRHWSPTWPIRLAKRARNTPMRRKFSISAVSRRTSIGDFSSVVRVFVTLPAILSSQAPDWLSIG